MDLKRNMIKISDCVEQQEPTINLSEYLQVQRSLLEIVEELKFRRQNDKENESRMQALMRENYEIVKKYDNEQKKNASLEGQYQKQIQELRYHYEEKLTNLQEEMHKYEVISSYKNEEIATLKEEIRNLQMAKYVCEKQIKDQEQKIQLQQMSTEHHTKQMSQIEAKFNSVASYIKTLLSSEKRLERNVQDVCGAQQKLAFIHKHQECILEQYKSDLKSSQNTVLKLNVNNQCTKDDIVKQTQIQMEITQLKQQLEKINIEKNEILAQLTNSNEKYQCVIDNLSEAHLLLDEQRSKANKYKEELNEQNKLYKETEEELKKLQVQFIQLNLTLENQNIKHLEQKQQWKKELEKLFSDLSVQTRKENLRKDSKEIQTKKDDFVIPNSPKVLECHEEFPIAKRLEEFNKLESTENLESMKNIGQQQNSKEKENQLKNLEKIEIEATEKLE